MRYILLALILPLTISFTTPGWAQDDAVDVARAKAFVTELADEAITILRTQSARTDREDGFRKLLDERANMRRIARFTLGTFARKISKEDFEVYQGLLNELIIKVYANRLGEFCEAQEPVLVLVGSCEDGIVGRLGRPDCRGSSTLAHPLEGVAPLKRHGS